MKKEEFELSTLKIKSDGKVHIEYRQIFTDGESVYADKNGTESPRIPHDDMKDALNDLSYLLAYSNDLYIHRKNSLTPPKLREGLDEKLMKAWDKAILGSMSVSGVSLGGDLETGWCIITGTHKVHHTGQAMNSPKVAFNSDSFGFENDLAKKLEKVIDEAYLYVFEKKGSQQVIPFKKEEAVAE